LKVNRISSILSLFPTKLRFESQQKKTTQAKKQKQAMFFSLLRFQLFVDLFVTPEGSKLIFYLFDIQKVIILFFEVSTESLTGLHSHFK